MKNKRLAIELIKNDCTLAGKYRDNKGGRCVIGCLAENAGAPLPKNKTQGNQSGIVDNYGESHAGVLPMIKAIRKKFGLSFSQQRELQFANDSIRGKSPRRIARRRIAVLDKLSEILSR